MSEKPFDIQECMTPGVERVQMERLLQARR